MTREEAINQLNDIKSELKEHLVKKDIVALDMAISALSAEGEYIKKEDALNKVEELKKIHFDRVVVLNKVSDGLNGLPTYSFPDREKGTNGNIITEMVEQDADFSIMTDVVNNTVSIDVSLEWWNAEYKGSFAVPDREKGTADSYRQKMFAYLDGVADGLNNPIRERGCWNGIDDEPYEDFECDCCGHIIYGFIENKEVNEVYKFCPNCGADMRESIGEKGE